MEGNTSNNIIKLNVGGSIFTTSKKLLTGKFFESLFQSGGEKDENGVWHRSSFLNFQIIFIDKDPEVFRVLLNYLRSGVFAVPKGVSSQLVEKDAGYYCIGLPPAFEESHVIVGFEILKISSKEDGNAKLVCSSQNPEILKVVEYIAKEMGTLKFGYGKPPRFLKSMITIPRLCGAMKDLGFDKFQFVHLPGERENPSPKASNRVNEILFWKSAFE